MGGFKHMCWLFCCPPVPSRIAAKFAFIPPPPTYDFVDADKIDKADATGAMAHAASQSLGVPAPQTLGVPAASLARRPTLRDAKREYLSLLDGGVLRTDRVEVMRLRTRRRETVAAMFYEHLGANLTILFSHGNAVDLGQMAPICIRLARDLRSNIMLYDYSGYGLSTGESTEKNLYADIEAAWEYLVEVRGIPPAQIVLYGQSIGTVPSVDLASRKHPLAVILHSPLASGLRVFTSVRATYCCDPFPSVEKIHLIESKVLIIHGLADRMISADHGKMLHAKCMDPAEPLWVDNAGHNDIEAFPEYMTRLRAFFDELYAQLPPSLRPSVIHQSFQALLMQPACSPDMPRAHGGSPKSAHTPATNGHVSAVASEGPGRSSSVSSLRNVQPQASGADDSPEPIARFKKFSASYRRATQRRSKTGKEPLHESEKAAAAAEAPISLDTLGASVSEV